jgi:hypothetical protein
MADVPSVRDVEHALEARVAELSQQIETITSTLADRGVDLFNDTRDRTGHAVADARRSRSVEHMKHEAATVAEAAKEAPIATTTTLATVALFGMAVGYLLGTSSGTHSSRW